MLNLKKSRYMLAVFALTVLTGCGSGKENNIISSELVSEESGFGLDKAQIGDFVDDAIFDAERVYPISNTITAAYDGVKLKEINVEAKQEVKKGDLLVTIEPITDEIIAEKEAEVVKNREEADVVLANYRSSIANLTQNVANSVGTEQELYQVELQKAQRQYEWYAQDANKVQAELQAEVERLRSIQGDINVYAPYDGIIDSVNNIQTGMELTTENELLKMHSEEQIMLEVAKGSRLRYGQSVTVETGSGENIKTYKGTVISANNVRGDSFKSGNAMVRIEEDVPTDELANVRVKANVKELHNVLVVKSYAINTEKEKNYVSIPDGDKMMKRRVITGGSCGEYTWILQGLKENQSVTIQ